jgi:hypothetical protein
MSPRRHRPITTIQALVGSVALLAAAAAVVGLSHLLRLPSLTTAPLPPPELEGPSQRYPGEVVCPTRGDLRDRPQPMPVTSAELIECPDLFDGERVAYAGEAVGAVLLRPTHAWVHLNDDVYANQLGPLSRHRTVVGGNSGMAVSMSRAIAESVQVGNSRSHGTGVRVVGPFFKAYGADGGAPAIEAEQATIVREAERFVPTTSGRRLLAAALLAPITLALLLLRRRQMVSAR